MPQKISALAVGAKVKDTGTLYYGKPIIWKIADKNHTGYPANSVTLITDKIITLKCFDGKEPSNSDANRQANGNNRYLHSNLRQWLNSDKAAGAWYTAQHGADAPPNSANTDYNPYDAQAGFLNGFSANLKTALISTTLTVVKNTVTDGGGSETVTDKIFLASNTEVGLTNENSIAEGVLLALFSDNVSRRAYPTAECVVNSNYQNMFFKETSRWYWWLRTPCASNSYYVRGIDNSDGVLDNNYVCVGFVGIRPLCNISTEILVSDTVDADGAYTMFNQPPTAPNGITPPVMTISGKSAEVSWGASTDADGSVSGYILERAYNGGAFTQIYKGANRTFTDTIAAGWTTVQYRVKAYDNANAESGYTTSALLTVIVSSPPVISGSDSSLGAKTGAFSQSYTVTNPDAAITKTLTVAEKIDGRQKRSFTATSGASNTFEVTAAEWLELLNGTHTLTITATDDYGGSTVRTYTFSKNETEVEFTLTTPLASDEAVTKAVMSVTRQIPENAAFTAEVCNNAYDTVPTWEDMTNAVVLGSKFFLRNNTKTAAKWGYNVRIKVKRLSGTGDCYIQGIGGNFE